MVLLYQSICSCTHELKTLSFHCQFVLSTSGKFNIDYSRVRNPKLIYRDLITGLYWSKITLKLTNLEGLTFIDKNYVTIMNSDFTMDTCEFSLANVPVDVMQYLVVAVEESKY